MEKLTADKVKYFIDLEEPEFHIDKLRDKHGIDAESSVFYTAISRMVNNRELKRLRRGYYKKIKKVLPVQVFGQPRERRPIFDLVFPRDYDTKMEMLFAEYVIIREGDLVSIGGAKSKCKTLLCLNFNAENIDRKPVLMGNEYTVVVEDKFEPAPRFLSRMDTMSEWVDWTDENGDDKFTLLPVREDYEEYVIPDRINIIDWINLDADRLYDISKVLENIKARIGRGVAIVALQKGEGAINPRGGQFVRDFSDLELLVDGLGDNDDEILLTIKGAKERTAPIVGKNYSFMVGGFGTKILDFREVKKCSPCRGSGYTKTGQCEECLGKKWINL